MNYLFLGFFTGLSLIFAIGAQNIFVIVISFLEMTETKFNNAAMKTEKQKTKKNNFAKLKQGHAICYASFINHRVQPVTRGVRQSLVVWFGGKPFR